MPLFSVLSRYIAKIFTLSFLGTLLALMSLIYLFDVIDLIQRASDKEHVQMSQILYLALLKSPNLLPQLLGFTVLIASLLTFYKLNKSQEIIITKSAGLSVWSFLKPIIFVVFLIYLLNIFALNPLSAILNKKFIQDKEIVYNKTTKISWLDDELWLKTHQDNIPIIVHAQNVSRNNLTLDLGNITVLFLNENEAFQKQLEAANAILSNTRIFIPEAYSYDYLGQKKEEKNIQIPNEMNIEEIIQTFESPEFISVFKLPSFIRMLEKIGFSSIEYRMFFYNLLASFFFLVAMVFIAAAFVLSHHSRRGGFLIKTMGAIGSGFILFFISRLTFALGLSSSLPIILSVLGPSVLALIFTSTALVFLEES